MRKSVSGPPTERELRLAAEWTRIARLIRTSIQSRMEDAVDESDDPLARYAPLKTLLNDDLVHELYACGEWGAAEEFRRRQHVRFAQLLSSLRAEVFLRHQERVALMDASGSWASYTEVFREAWFMRGVLARLRTALWLHSLSLPGSLWMVRAAWRDLQRIFPPAHIVPIRP